MKGQPITGEEEKTKMIGVSYLGRTSVELHLKHLRRGTCIAK
jgi:hypothetical protein